MTCTKSGSGGGKRVGWRFSGYLRSKGSDWNYTGNKGRRHPASCASQCLSRPVTKCRKAAGEGEKRVESWDKASLSRCMMARHSSPKLYCCKADKKCFLKWNSLQLAGPEALGIGHHAGDMDTIPYTLYLFYSRSCNTTWKNGEIYIDIFTSRINSINIKIQRMLLLFWEVQLTFRNTIFWMRYADISVTRLAQQNNSHHHH